MFSGQGAVGWDAVAGFDPHEIAGDQQGGVEVGELAVLHGQSWAPSEIYTIRSNANASNKM